MGRVLAARELSTAQIISLRDSVKTELLRRAMVQTGKKVEDLVVRDALPYEDFSFNNNKPVNQTAQVSATWTKDWSKQLPKTKFVAFYGVVNHTDDPTILGTKFKVGSAGQTTRDIVMHGRVRAEDIVKAFFDTVYYDGDETIYVEHQQASGSTVAQYAEEIELMAFVCEPFGEQISNKAKTV